MEFLVVMIMLAGLFVFWQWITRFKSRNLPPGPFSWPIVGCIFSLRQPLHRHVTMLSLKYGPVVHLKVGMVHVVVASSSEMAKEVLHTKDLEFAYRPRTTLFRYFSLGYRDIICTPYGKHWKTMRRVAHSNMFTGAKLDATASIREAEMKFIVQTILRVSEKVVDLREVLGEYFSRIVCVTLFGRDDRAKQVVDAVAKLSGLIVNVNIGDIFPALDCLDLHGLNKTLRTEFIPQLTSLLSEMISQERDVLDRGATHVLAALLKVQQYEEALSDECIMAMMIDTISAGVDTSRAVAEWTMAEIISNPKIMQRAQAEIDDAVGKTRLVQDDDLPKLPFVQAILKETLRLHPAIPLGVAHTNPKPSTIGGYTIPARTQVLINIWAIGRDPRRWSRPDEFLPERFLGSKMSHNFDLIPFSAGKRVCAGSTLALRSILLAVATMVQAFDWGGTTIDLKEQEGMVDCKLASTPFSVATSRLDNRVYYA